VAAGDAAWPGRTRGRMKSSGGAPRRVWPAGPPPELPGGGSARRPAQRAIWSTGRWPGWTATM